VSHVRALVRGRELLPWLNPLLAGALCALGYVELLAPARYQGDPVWPGPVAANVAVVAGVTLPLAWRRRFPTAAPAVALVVLGVASAVLGGGEATTTFLVFIVATFTVVAHGRFPAAGAVGVVVVGAVHEVRDPHVHGVGDVVWAFGIVVVAALIGLAVRTRQLRIGDLETQAERAEREHSEQVMAALAAERAAIARELHDMVSHLVAVIVIQAQAGARALPADVEHAAEALATIEQSGRSALTELRQLLTVLSDEETHQVPLASLERLGELADGCRSAGLEIALEVNQVPPLSPLCDATAYRVIQEALTNTIRHAPGARTRVAVAELDGLVDIVVEDSGGGRGAGAGAGRGLIGMRERVALAGGAVTAGPSDGGWRVHAELPLDQTADARRGTGS